MSVQANIERIRELWVGPIAQEHAEAALSGLAEAVQHLEAIRDAAEAKMQADTVSALQAWVRVYDNAVAALRLLVGGKEQA